MVTTHPVLDDLTGIAALAITTWGALAGAKLGARLRRDRPRLCSCGHGHGPHGADGCTGRTMHKVNGHDVLEDCRCVAFDGCGARVR